MTDTARSGGPPPAADESKQPQPQPYGYVAGKSKDALINPMRRIEGQARGIEKMITLEMVAAILLDDHVNRCVRQAFSSGDEAVAAERTTELLEAVHRFTQTR